MKDRIYTRRDFVSASVLAGLAAFGGTLLTACAPNGSATPGGSGSSPLDTGSTTTTGAAIVDNSGGATTPGNTQLQSNDLFGKYRIPHYPGATEIPRFDFKWPSIERFLVQAATAEWSYASSDDAPAKVEEWYREQFKTEQYKKRERYFFDRSPEGLMTIFFDKPTSGWIRVWSIPRPDDASKTNIAIAADPIYHFCGG